jgi:cell division topological specificity factor
MPDWLDRLFGKEPASANQAKERLKLVLINDRTDLSPQELEIMKNELIEVIARHVDIDPTAVNISMTQEGREQRLVADIPIRPQKRRGGSKK